MNLQEFKQQNPAYKDVPDDKLADGLYKKFYSNIPRDQFNQKLGIGQPSVQAAPQVQAPMQQQVSTNPAPAQPSTINQLPQSGFIDRVTQDVKNREQMGEKIMTTPNQNPLSVGLQMAGKVAAGTAADIAGEAGKSLWSMLPDSIKANIMNDPITKTAVAGAKTISEAYNAVQNSDFMKQHPEAKANLEAVADIAQFVPAMKGAGLAQKAAGEATGVSGIAKGIAAPSSAKQDLILGGLHDAANKTIENVKNSGVKFKPKVVDPLVLDLQKHPDLQTMGEAGNRPQTSKIVGDLVTSLTGDGKNLMPDNSLRNLIGFRDQLSGVAVQSGADGAAAKTALKMVDKTLDNIPEFKKFQKQWGMYKLGQSVQNAMQLADISPAKSRAAFAKIVDSDYFKGFDPQIQSLLKTAAKGKASGKFFETLGLLKKGVSLGIKKGGSALPLTEAGLALVSGHPAVAGAIGGSIAAAKGGELVQRGLGADVLKYLQNNQ